jgi:pyruvate dehydrogenase E2 component (dihydrolipoamide acetyltransferase)
MAETREVRIPDIGEVEGVTVAEVLVKPGDEVDADADLVVLESDKASMEVPSPVAGKVAEIKVSVGDEVTEGTVILTLEVAEDAASAEAEEPPEEEPEDEKPETEPEDDEEPEDEEPEDEEPEDEEPEDEQPEDEEPEKKPADERPAGEHDEIDEEAFAKAYASPAVRRFARELGVDLGQVSGSGRKERITKEDVQRFVKRALASPAAAGGGGFELPPMPEIDFSNFGPVETRALSRIRKLSAKNVHRSWLHVPHVTQHEDADVTEMEAFRKAHAEEAKEKGFKLTPVAFLLRACAAALRDFPDFNSSLDPGGENLILKRYFHLGVAVDTPGGLVVPVIRDVDKKGIFELARELTETSGRARDGKLTPKDFQGGCFTISSLGGIGGTAFTPIVNAPEVAILGVSRSRMTPVWRDGELVPRLMLPLSLSYDHRVIDGASAARFVVHLSGLLGDLRKLLL